MRLTLLTVLAILVSVSHSTSAQDIRPSYLDWSAADAERIGKSTRVNGRVGGMLDFRVIHTEHSYNYKLRATLLTHEVIQATARKLQLMDHLTDKQTVELVREGINAGDLVVIVEIDPREGSGVIPNEWSAFLGPSGKGSDVSRGENSPALEKMKALRGVYRRDYNYELFWVVFPLKNTKGTSLFPSGTTQATLSVRISGKEGRVKFPIPAYLCKK